MEHITEEHLQHILTSLIDMAERSKILTTDELLQQLIRELKTHP
ncbi:hypothetical protein [Pontibacillus yanchengensis]|nr:hypothetical protein [Pontibacillus yanchengensis]